MSDPADDRAALDAGTDAAVAWFEPLYSATARGEGRPPWDRDVPQPLLVEWLANHPLESAGRRAAVVGCGTGNDAELIAARGFRTTAFDVSATALDLARDRYPDSVVDYRRADLFDLPPDWPGSFDLVIESFTVQALPPRLHRRAAAAIASLCSVGGLLVVIAFARTDDAEPDGPPWPLAAEELSYFAVDGVERAVVETVPAGDGTIRWRAEFRRPDPVNDKDRSLQHWL